MIWHVDPALLDRYGSGADADARMASVEIHVTSCSTCRSLVTSRSEGHASRERIKAAIDERLDTPPAGWVERTAGHMGLNESDSRIVGATLALHGSWLAACVLTLAFVAVAAATGPARAALAAFLLGAPLVPIVGVSLAYGPRVDPTFEIATAATMPGVRIALLRTLAVTGPTIPSIAAISLVVPFGGLAFAWLLPAVGLAAASLALGTIVPPARAAAGVTAFWLLGAALSLEGAPRSGAEAFVRGFPAFRPSGQVLFATIAVASMMVVALRRAEFETAR